MQVEINEALTALDAMNQRRLLFSQPALFAFYDNPNYDIPRHIKLLNQTLIDVFNGKIKRLIINMPPRHGKSELVSKYFPAWYFFHRPETKIILASYEADFAATWGRHIRGLIHQHGEFFHIEMAHDSNSAKRFDILFTDKNNKHRSGGTFYAAGAGGAITGKGADVMIIDDPVKNSEEANSKHMRDKIWDWYQSTARTRLQPGGAMIIIMTRWHEDDLAGRLIAEDKARKNREWTVLSLPAIAEENDVLGRTEGEPLWAERYDIDALKELQRNVGQYWFNSLFQQRPTPAEGGIFKKQFFSYYNGAGEFLKIDNASIHKSIDLSIFSIADLAATTSTHSDYTVVTTWGATRDGKLLLLDMFREKIEGANHIDVLLSVNRNWHPDYIGIESVQYQITLVQQARNMGLPAIELRAEKDKWTRALPAAAMFEAGLIFFPEKLTSSITAIVEDELLAFPHGKNDDIVDTVAYAALRMQHRREFGFEFHVANNDHVANSNLLRNTLTNFKQLRDKLI